MSNAALLEQEREQARQRVERFVRRFEPSYRYLAYHAALPLVLTPELLNYLRNQFLREENVPWIAEVDLLLSDLCRPVGFEQYAMDAAVKAYLLNEMEQVLGQDRLEAVARLIVRYIRQLANNPYIDQRELETQQWAAMVYIENQRSEAVRQISRAYQECATATEAAGNLSPASRAEMARLARITQELAPRLNDYASLLAYAELVRRVLTEPSQVSGEQLNRSFQIVEDIALQLPQELLPEDHPARLEVQDEETAFAYEALEQNLEVIRRLIEDAFSQQEHEFRLSVHPWENEIHEVILDQDGEISVEILAKTLIERLEKVVSFELSVTINFSAEIRYPNNGILDRDIIDEVLNIDEIPNLDEIGAGRQSISNQTANGVAEINLFFSEKGRNEVETELEQLRVEQPILVDLINLIVPRSPSADYSDLTPPLHTFEFKVATINFESTFDPFLAIDLQAFEFEVAVIDSQQLREIISPTILGIGEVLKKTEEIVLNQTGKGLNGDQQLVLEGTWYRKTYEEIADDSPNSAAYIRQHVGPQLWKLFSTAFQAKVSKNNFPNEFTRWIARRDRSSSYVHYHRQQAWCFIENLGNGFTLEMVQIRSGSFVMGAPENETESSDNERPQHLVTVSTFFIGKYPVTQSQWRAVAALPQVNLELEPDPSNFKGDDRPVERVSWWESVEFCDRLSRHTGKQYRLPSEAEWEYACRASPVSRAGSLRAGEAVGSGAVTPFHFGETLTSDLANYNGEYTYGAEPKGIYQEETTPVGSFGVANAFGLYDMHGNVWDWCADHWHESYEGAPIDGSAWVTSRERDRRVLRGGSWCNDPHLCRSAYRGRNDAVVRYDHFGFRVACSA
ncbi:formylglycine-generating enzyme family protein [Kovacikia minuta CCNUW1]|uniref:formylglycine-generating enzyme family protein n=1 Tax=Kovacikia minuta TaxID=2931930 RepID=UPI001CCF2FD9|nr:formylglycine-generating enzyme family protein [Kovacikia minuta]UBF27480.1 formylglycine-generating enzyme family protein [Kovacikia minuta CCNUW1]